MCKILGVRRLGRTRYEETFSISGRGACPQFLPARAIPTGIHFPYCSLVAYAWCPRPERQRRGVSVLAGLRCFWNASPKPPENDSANRAMPIANIANRVESTGSGSPAASKSVQQRAQAAIHASVMAMFSDWLRLNIRIVKNAQTRPKVTTIQSTVNS